MTRTNRRRWMLTIPYVLALAGTALLLADEPEEGRRYALVVGVQNYEGTGLGNLKYCDNDAAGLAETLGKLGYRVTVLTRPEWKAKDGRDDLLPTADNIRDHLKAGRHRAAGVRRPRRATEEGRPEAGCTSARPNATWTSRPR
jgi:Caspase domain